MTWWQQHSKPVEALVCGASRGIGLALCTALLANPQVARVWAVARHAGQSAELQRLASQYPERLYWRDLDIADEGQLQAFAAGLRDAMPHLHLLINCVGVLQEGAVHAEKSLAQVDLAGLQASFLRNSFAATAARPPPMPGGDALGAGRLDWRQPPRWLVQLPRQQGRA